MWGKGVFYGVGQTNGCAQRPPNFWTSYTRAHRMRKKNKFCMVIKLDVRKVFTESTTPAMADTDTIVDA